jgi:murein DD-endopeptidase MepM/ murein hydrolase activator NlpD
VRGWIDARVMRTEHPTYRLRSLRCTALLLVAAAAVAVAAGSTRAAPAVPPAVALHTACTNAGASGTATAPRLVRVHAGQSQRTSTYGWPVKPFSRQHPVRGFMNDPRSTFHFGIDIAVPDGTAVYAVAAGTAGVRQDDRGAVRVVEIHTHGASLFSYWHIVPAVRQGQRIALHQLIGRVARGWGHVHFGERDGVYFVNPLRNGGIGPYVDRTTPTVVEIGFDGTDLVAAAYDTPDLPVPGAWADEPVTPGLLRWRSITAAGIETPWQTAFDFRAAQLRPSLFRQVYTGRTRGNRTGDPGQYCFFLQRQAKLHAGAILEVAVTDTAGNSAVYAVALDDVRGSL